MQQAVCHHTKDAWGTQQANRSNGWQEVTGLLVHCDEEAANGSLSSYHWQPITAGAIARSESIQHYIGVALPQMRGTVKNLAPKQSVKPGHPQPDKSGPAPGTSTHVVCTGPMPAGKRGLSVLVVLLVLILGHAWGEHACNKGEGARPVTLFERDREAVPGAPARAQFLNGTRRCDLACIHQVTTTRVTGPIRVIHTAWQCAVLWP